MDSRSLYTLFSLLSVATASLVPKQTLLPSGTPAAAVPHVTAITGCHVHGSQLLCIAGETEYTVQTSLTQTTSVPAQFTDCHSHGSELFCVGPNGDDVQVQQPSTGGAGGNAAHGDAHDHAHEHESTTGEKKNCHFHAGVEHCTSEGETESAPELDCGFSNREYNVGLRVGLLFVIMATSALGVFGPILLHKILPNKLSVVFVVLKQFGTGIIISTALIHLYTHAALMFGNKCLGDLGYEGTTSAILMAGLFLSFLVEYIGQRIVLSKTRAAASMSQEHQANMLLSTEVVSILVMEAGILFHSLLIGLTLVVSGDSFFITLFIVILFHQIFEGLALGTRIATIGTCADMHVVSSTTHNSRETESETDKSPGSPTITSSSDVPPQPALSMKKKLGLAALFAFITPIGMAIGIGVLQKFNGNDRSTLIAIGTLDALSAGILLWVGVVEMWAGDWMVGSHGHKAELAEADMLTVALGGFGLVAGLALMSILGKWA